ncbi:hypothetical protein K1719_045807 [Acacia pycnantha]|nr:hypothetical protein K1719_045807 [Acacia pycnantha]
MMWRWKSGCVHNFGFKRAIKVINRISSSFHPILFFSFSCHHRPCRISSSSAGAVRPLPDLACLRSSPPSINSTDTVEGYDYRSSRMGSYTKKQLKNRYDSLRREWRAWEKLFLKETGIAIDYASNVVIAEDEWWERKIKGYSSIGEEFECPSLTRLDEDDVYRPQMNLDEGSGDSEEELFGTSTGVSVQMPSDLEGMNLTSNTEPSAPSGSTSIGKRKRGEGVANVLSSSVLVLFALRLMDMRYFQRGSDYVTKWDEAIGGSTNPRLLFLASFGIFFAYFRRVHRVSSSIPRVATSDALVSYLLILSLPI